jgi:hypothetical protein
MRKPEAKKNETASFEMANTAIDPRFKEREE